MAIAHAIVLIELWCWFRNGSNKESERDTHTQTTGIVDNEDEK